MPPFTQLPRPQGHIKISYSPMSPMNWGLAPFNVHYFVYRDVREAMQAMLQAVTTIHAQRLEAQTASLFDEYIHYRGQADVTHRLLPTRLRGKSREQPPRQRYAVPEGEARNHFGDWYDKIEGRRTIEETAEDLPPDVLSERDAIERDKLERANEIADVRALDEFRQRCVVRHYAGAPSSLMDVSTNVEIAAFFATGGGASQPSPAGQIGMLWGVDLNFLAGLFEYEVSDVPGGSRIKAREQREAWGVNAQMFEEQGIDPVSPELTFVSLPFRRPIAQHARFFSLTGGDGTPLPLMTELTWWSIIERTAAGCAFIQDGEVYENPSHNITLEAVLPTNESLATALS